VDRIQSRTVMLHGGGPALCVGLDPHTSELNLNSCSVVEEELWAFCRAMIEATSDVAVCYKPNSAFFEAHGSKGFRVLERVCDSLHKQNFPILLDSKRGDIASTAEAYASASFDVLRCDAVTVNAYMGRDSLDAFYKRCQTDGKGIFVLCKTSNPGSADLQGLLVSSPPSTSTSSTTTSTSTSSTSTTCNDPLFMRVSDLCADLDAPLRQGGCVGVVVGATDVTSIQMVRQRHPDIWILAPGVGFQGGKLDTVVQSGCRSGGGGLIVPVSRAISRSQDKKAAAVDLQAKLLAASKS